MNGTNGFTIHCVAGDGCGKASALLDVSGDGIVDILLGAPLSNNCIFCINYYLKILVNNNEGNVYVIYGKNFTSDFNISEINGNNGFSILSYTEDMKLGSSIAALGDFNKFFNIDIKIIYFISDGSKDFVIGTESGNAFLIYGHGKEVYTCHISCKTCDGALFTNCLTCADELYYLSKTCLSSCPSATIQNED